MPHILLIEPDPDRRAAMANTLASAGFEVTAVSDVDAGFSPLGRVAAVVCNALLPSGTGLRLLQFAGTTPVIVSAAQGSVRAAVAAMKAGAANYLVHPIDPEELVGVVQIEIASRDASASSAGTLPRHVADAQLVGRCAAMADLRQRIGELATTDAPVLVIGEVGTGKESVARALHARSARRSEALLSLNTSRVPEHLLATEIFGVEMHATEGAVLGRAGLLEAADGGTLFIEDIADLPGDVQERLLHAVETGALVREDGHAVRKIDVRLVAATRRDVLSDADHLNVVPELLRRFANSTLDLPPLRDRRDDLVELACELLARTCSRLKRPEPRFSDEALQAICDYAWPGNVRELENAIERAVILNDGRAIEVADLGIELPRSRPAPAPIEEDATTLEDYFVRFVTEHEDSLTETELAQKLGISRKSLWERRQRLNIPRRRTRTRGPRRDD